MTNHSKKEIRRQKNRESALRSRQNRDSLLSQLESCANMYLTKIRDVRSENNVMMMRCSISQIDREFYPASCANSENANINYSDEKSVLKPTAFLLHI